MRGEYGCVNDVYTFLAPYRAYRARGENMSKRRLCLLTLRLRVWDGDEKSACFFATGVRLPLAVGGRCSGIARSRARAARRPRGEVVGHRPQAANFLDTREQEK